jgi:hypothetical protein
MSKPRATGHTIEEAIIAVTRAIHFGVPDVACQFDLVQDGFDKKKAAIIVRWALQANRMKPSQKKRKAQ